MENIKMPYESPDATIETIDSKDIVLVSLESIPWDDISGESNW